MDGRRGRIAATLVAASAWVLGPAGAAQAALPTTRPPLYAKPSAGPFTWGWRPGFDGEPVAWKLSSEIAWHRCTTATGATFATLPDGHYSIAVADDVPGCSPAETDAPGTPVAQSRVTVIDGTAPVVGVPVVTVRGLQARTVSVAATDAVSGVASYTWSTGDGFPVFQRPIGFARTYQFGTYTGSVTVTDNAGNAATQPFTVDVRRPVPVPDVRAPRIGGVQVARRVLARRALAVRLTLDEAGTVALTATIRASGRTYRVPVAKRKLAAGRPVTVRLAVRRAVRRAIARALRRHRAVRASLTVVAADAVGNRSAPKTTTGRILG
jgi:hypothetical protein